MIFFSAATRSKVRPDPTASSTAITTSISPLPPCGGLALHDIGQPRSTLPLLVRQRRVVAALSSSATFWHLDAELDLTEVSRTASGSQPSVHLPPSGMRCGSDDLEVGI
jgi:hypothetical protein